MKCPKCGYVRQSSDEAPAWQCPACHVAYAKVSAHRPSVPEHTPRLAAPPQRVAAPATPPPAGDDPDHDELEAEREERHWYAAQGQKLVIYSIALNFLVGAIGRSQLLPELALQGLSSGVGLIALLGVIKICSGLEKTQNQKLVFMTLAFFPLINILAFVYLSIKTTKMLRSAGWRVGLLGAKP